MLIKKILTCFFAVSIVCCSFSFVTKPSLPVQKESSFAIVPLFKQFNVAGVNYNVYWEYDTVSGTVSNFQVFLDDCTVCKVSSVSGSATFIQTGTFMWHTSGSITVNTTCGSFVITGYTPSQLPYC